MSCNMWLIMLLSVFVDKLHVNVRSNSSGILLKWFSVKAEKLHLANYYRLLRQMAAQTKMQLYIYQTEHKMQNIRTKRIIKTDCKLRLLVWLDAI